MRDLLPKKYYQPDRQVMEAPPRMSDREFDEMLEIICLGVFYPFTGENDDSQ